MLEAALLFLVFFGPLAFGCVEPWSRSLLEIAIFSLPLLATAKTSRPVVAWPKACIAAFIVLLAVGAAQALNPAPVLGPRPLLPFTASAWLTQTALLLWVSYGVLLCAAPGAFSSPHAVRRFAWSVVLIGSLVAAIGLVQSAQGNKLILGFREVTYGMSPFGPYYNRGHAASLLAVSTLMGLGLFASGLARIMGHSRSKEPVADQLAVQALLAFLIGLGVVGWLSMLNRGSLLAFWGASLFAGVLCCGLIKAPSHRWTARALVVILFLASAAVALRLGILQRGAQASVPVRFSIYQSGLSLLADAPLWGTGLGTFVTAFGPYYSSPYGEIVDHAHSDWLEVPAEIGLPAAALLLAALILLGRRIHRSWTREPSLERRLLMAGGFAAAMCFLLHAMVEFPWQIPANAVIFLLILSWLWSQTDQSDCPKIQYPPSPVAIVVLAALSLVAVRPAVGWVLMKSGRYEAAFAWDANPVYLSLAKLQSKSK